MSLLTRLQEDMKTAMKSGQKERLSVLRMLISDVKNIDLQTKKLTEEETVAGYGKKLRKSIEEYEKLNKAAEVAQLKSELAVVEEYLPKKASGADTERLVDEFLSKNSFTEKEFGKAMGMFMKAHGAAVDPSQANAMLKQKLAGK
ncbi:MAG TPA: GatB/YqeY domain-containing protein [Tepidisphaeraceae bacterium]|jgi:hypothetical protein|nr:GatB/YqeY domain-containing protein [Tepidisphaeraceae bacterium]